MYNAAHAFGYSLDTRILYLRWLSVRMESTWPAQVSGFTSADEWRLTSAPVGEDLSISLWDLGSGKRIKKMTGHTASIYSLAFSAESSLLVSGSADWTVRCWDVNSAGGLPWKNRENGIVNGDATENGHDPAEKQEESNQT